jgi:hypothetical protein
MAIELIYHILSKSTVEQAAWSCVVRDEKKLLFLHTQAMSVPQPVAPIILTAGASYGSS